MPTRRTVLGAGAALATGVVSAVLVQPASAADAGHEAAAAVPWVPHGVSPRFAKQLRGHPQVVVAMGAALDSDRVEVSDWVRTARGWKRVGRWSGYNGAAGWSTDHHAGDLHTPVGVYSLTNAGGYNPNPGTRLPYQHSSAYSLIDNGVRTFAYVVGINYNHVVGTPPLDHRRPLGVEKGGDIWLHVAHGSGTHACVSIPEDGLRSTLRWLRPASHPVIIMGPRSLIGA